MVSLQKSIILGLIFLLAPVSLCEKSPDHETKSKPAKKQLRRAGKRPPGEDPCLGGRGLAAFANGDDFNLGGMVSFLTEAGCQERQNQIVREALSQRISFNEEPFRLKQVAANFNPSSAQSIEHANQHLQRSLPITLREHSLSNEALLPVLGQVAILSQPAARKILAEMIQKELISSDALIKNSKREAGVLASELAQTLLNYGANTPAIASELSEATEEMALSAQVDSLGRVLSALAEAARSEGSLIPTLEVTVGAARRGAEKGEVFFSSQDSQDLLLLFFERVKSEFLGDPEFEGVSSDYNRALKALLKNKALNKTPLRQAWRESLKILAMNRQQSSLARALALSLTGDSVYLSPSDKQLLLSAANNYRVLALSVQRSFLSAWNEAWTGLHERRIPPKLFNERKDRYFIPTVAGIFDLDPEYLEKDWVQFVWEKGFVQDEVIETRFPKMVLVLLKRRENSLRTLATDTSFAGQIAALAESLSANRFLSSVQIPALNQWLKKNEAPESSPSDQ